MTKSQPLILVNMCDDASKIAGMDSSRRKLFDVTTVLNEKFASLKKTPAFDVKLVPSAGDPHGACEENRDRFWPVSDQPAHRGWSSATSAPNALPIPLPIIADTSATWFFDEKDR
jgi:hypothetical protein